MNKPRYAPGQIWRDECYYLDAVTQSCKPKYFAILALSGDQTDFLTAVLTSKPNGLTEHPACCLGPPRAGFYLGVLGGPLQKPTWIDFSSLRTMEDRDLNLLIQQKRTTIVEVSLETRQLRSALECLRQSDDISGRQARWIADTLAGL